MKQSHTRVYLFTFAALLCLLVLTIAAAMLEPGPWSGLVAVSIATAKAVLIVLFFMHVREETALVRIFAFAGFLWLGLLMLLMLSDYLTRVDVIPAGDNDRVAGVHISTDGPSEQGITHRAA